MLALPLVLTLALSAAGGLEDGLVAHYTFEEGGGQDVRDASGHGHDGKAVAATFIKEGDNRVICFDGEQSRVDFGECEGLGIRDAVTVSTWILADCLPTGEVGVAGKGIDSFGLTFYKYGKCWWYISGGGNNCKGSIGVGFWHMVTGTYDGKTMRLYVDGRLEETRELAVKINTSGRLMLGEEPRAGGRFAGCLDEVRVYNRAFAPEEVAALYKATSKRHVVERAPVKSVAELKGKGFALKVGPRGGLQIDVGKETYLIETAFSYPGDRVSWNRFADSSMKAKAAWAPKVERVSDTEITISAQCDLYSVKRRACVRGDRVDFEDTIASASAEPVGVMVDTCLIAPDVIEDCRLCGARQSGASMAAENPTILVTRESSSMAVVAQDTVFRLQLSAGYQGNVVRFGLSKLGLAATEKRTLEWTVYPAAGSTDYFDFLNRLRNEWGSNYTVRGPFDYLDVTSSAEMLADKAKLTAFLDRSKLKVVALVPWLDYDNYNYQTFRPTTRDEYREMMRKAMAALKAVDPEILCIGCMEGNLVTLPPEVASAVYETIPASGRRKGIFLFTPEQMEILKQHELRWQDCLLRDASGRCRYELYYRGEGDRRLPMLAIAVYAAQGNGQHQYWMDQAKFMIEDVGLDGVYIDQFSLAFSASQRYSYEKWDGTTVDIDPRTGRITRCLTDGALVGVPARGDLMRYVLAKGKVMVANTHCAVRELQQLPVNRFLEGEWAVDALGPKPGQEPALSAYLCKAQLDSPLSLGVRPERYGQRGRNEYARAIMKTAVAYLRHGVLYYHYGSRIPEDGPGSGEYGPFNHMFPLTPVALHKGWVEGKERIVTCVSGRYMWPHAERPHSRLFDMEGRPVAHKFGMVKVDGRWEISVTIRDWEQIAIIEK